MSFRVFATDFDGTLAHHGHADQAAVAALADLRAQGWLLMLVTGRELPSLFATFDQTELFHRIVAENGGVLYTPATKTVRRLAASPPPALVARLQEELVPITIGHSVIATVEPYEHNVLAAIRDLGLEWHVTFNKGAVMTLPSSVTKATGLLAGLDELGVPAGLTVGIGDAENDHAFLQSCGLAVAVANALPAVKSSAAVVTEASHGAGVVELVQRLMKGDFDTLPAAVTKSTRS
jgi:hydroxymethylpyrimidine pyrophosphatase-like HAD family hydrolase